MKLEDIKELIKVVAEEPISELEIEQAGVRVRIVSRAPSEPAAILQTGSGAETVVVAQPASEPAVAAEEAADAGSYIVTSPMVGTFYRAPDPNSEPFIQVGDKVRQGQVLCIIEAMKLMNEVESEVAGEVVAIYAENGQPVEFGDRICGIKPLSDT